MINTLFISYNLNKIKSANYQIDIFNELEKKLKLDCLFLDDKYYEKNLLSSYNKKYELIIIGHFFLSDIENYSYQRPKTINFKKFKSPIIFFLNKEYVNLTEKIKWINDVKPNIILTHSKKFFLNFKNKFNNSEVIYMPFAANEKIFGTTSNLKKKYDLSFSGILQNQNNLSDQSDMRLNIMKNIFFNFLDIPLSKRKKFKSLNIFWNTIPRKPISRKIARIIGKYSFLSLKSYAQIQKETKIYLNSLSPFGIISPRYYENFLSRCLIFSEKSDYLNTFADDELIVTFNSLEEFNEKLFYYLENTNEINAITNKAYNYGKINHTWSKRIDDLINDIGHIL